MLLCSGRPHLRTSIGQRDTNRPAFRSIPMSWVVFGLLSVSFDIRVSAEMRGQLLITTSCPTVRGSVYHARNANVKFRLPGFTCRTAAHHPSAPLYFAAFPDLCAQRRNDLAQVADDGVIGLRDD